MTNKISKLLDEIQNWKLTEAWRPLKGQKQELADSAQRATWESEKITKSNIYTKNIYFDAKLLYFQKNVLKDRLDKFTGKVWFQPLQRIIVDGLATQPIINKPKIQVGHNFLCKLNKFSTFVYKFVWKFIIFVEKMYGGQSLRDELDHTPLAGGHPIGMSSTHLVKQK